MPRALEAGVHFTPPALATTLARRVLAREGGGVLDPACGDGALLVAAWRVGRGLGLRAGDLHGIEIDAGLAERARRRLRREIGGRGGERAAENVRVADALSPDVPWPAGTHVLANPPWVSFSGRQASGRDARVAGWLAGARGWPSLHGAFLARISEHVAAEGTRAGVLLPGALCEARGYGALRHAVSARAGLAAPPEDLGEAAFEGVVEPAVLLELEPRAANAPPASDAPWDGPPREHGALLDALRDHPRLPARAFGDPGVHTGNSARALIREPGEGLPLVREGRDLVAFRLGAPRLALDVRVQRSAERRFRYGPLERYRAVPVLVRQTADRPIAALHTAPTYFRNTLLACSPPPELDPAFVVAVLNSPVAAAWHRLSFRDARQRTFPQVKVAHLRSLPFPFLRRAEAPRLHDRVRDTVRALATASGPTVEAQGRRLDRWILSAFGLLHGHEDRIRDVAG